MHVVGICWYRHEVDLLVNPMPLKVPKLLGDLLLHRLNAVHMGRSDHRKQHKTRRLMPQHYSMGGLLD